MKKALICMMQLHKNSGSARTAHENMRYFKDRGYEVHVASMTADLPSLKKENVIFHRMLPWLKSTGITRRRWYNWQIQRLRKKHHFDITVGHGDIQVQDVLTLHNSVFLASELIHGRPLDPSSEMALTHGPLLEKQGFKKMIANSVLMKEDTIKRFKVNAEKIHVIYPALDTKIFFPVDEETRKKLRDRFGFGDKIVVSLVTSGNFKKRGLDIFIEALALLPPALREKIDVRAIGKDGPGPFQGKITFDPPLDDIQNYYNAIDLFVLPARIEEFGRVVLEAMGCGKAVITTDKVGAGELLRDESRRFVLPSHDASKLAAAMSELIQDSNLRDRLGALNAKTALEEAEDHLYPKFDRIFKDMT